MILILLFIVIEPVLISAKDDPLEMMYRKQSSREAIVDFSSNKQEDTIDLTQ